MWAKLKGIFTSTKSKTFTTIDCLDYINFKEKIMADIAQLNTILTILVKSDLSMIKGLPLEDVIELVKVIYLKNRSEWK